MSTDSYVVDNVLVFIVVVIALAISICLGVIVGKEKQNRRWNELCEKAGVEFECHENTVNGIVVTNWVECVRIK